MHNNDNWYHGTMHLHALQELPFNKYQGCRLDHYIIFHLSHYFLGGKIGGISLQGHFGGWSKFGNLGPKNSQKYSGAILRHQTTFFFFSKPYYGGIF
jgi:hypothetical protein